MARLLLFVAVALALAGAKSATAQDIDLAVVGPLTGSNAAFGEQMLRGAAAAVNDANAKGGVLGRQIRLLIADDACDPGQAVLVAGQMVARGAQVIIGHYCSGSSIPASVIYHAAKVLQISPGSTIPALTERKFENVFRVCGRADDQSRMTTDYLQKNYKGKTIAVIDDNSTFGKGSADEVREGLRAAGLPVAFNGQIDASQDDYSELIEKLAKVDPQVVYYGGYQGEAGLVVKQARAAHITAHFVSGVALAAKEFWQVAGPAGEGMVMTGHQDARDNPSAKDVVAAFRREHYDPEGNTLYAYAAVQIYVQAVQAAHATDLLEVTKALHAQRFDTVYGPITFDAKGDNQMARFVMLKWHNGVYSRLQEP